MGNVSETALTSNSDTEHRQAAREKWKTFHDTDPFDDIPRTLLSGVDIERYVEKVGLIYPRVST
jgi:hypothetical protein